MKKTKDIKWFYALLGLDSGFAFMLQGTIIEIPRMCFEEKIVKHVERV